MSSSLQTSKSREVVENEVLLKLLTQRVAVRYMLFSDQYNSPRLTAYVFGLTLLSREFFWMETSAGANGAGRVNFEIWDREIPSKMIEKFSEWETKGVTHPWWGQLVTDRLFECVHIHGISSKKLQNVPADNHQLLFFHGLLVARLQAHLGDVNMMAVKDLILRPRADLFEQLFRRFLGFVDQARTKQLAEMLT